MTAEGDTAQRETEDTPRKPRRWRRRSLIAAALVGAFVLLLGLLLPWYVSSGAGERWLIEALEPEFRTEVSANSVEFGWTRGLRIEGLQIAQPDGVEGEALHIGAIEAELSYATLLGGRVDVVARILDPIVHVTRGADGSLNWPAILPEAHERRRDGEGRDPREREEFEWPRLNLDLGLERGIIEIVDLESGERQRVHSIAAAVRNQGFELPLILSLQARAPAGVDDNGTASEDGSLRVDAELDLRAGRANTAALVVDTLDLAPWGSMLAAFGGVVDRLEGSVGGTLSAGWNTPRNSQARESGRVAGEVHGSDVIVEGGALGPRSLRLPKVRLEPKLSWTREQSGIDTEGLDLGFGVLRVRGTPEGTARELLPESSGSSIALDLVVRLDELMAQEGWRPEGIDELGGVYRMRVAAVGDFGLLPLRFPTARLDLRLKGTGGWVKFAADALPPEVKVPPDMSLDIPASWDASGLHFTDAQVSLGQTTLAVSGAVSGESLRASGSAMVDAALARSLARGHGGEHLHVEGPVHLRRFELELPFADAEGGEVPGGGLGLPGSRLSVTRAELELPPSSFLDNRLSAAGLSLHTDPDRIETRLEAILNEGSLALAIDWATPEGLAGPANLRLGWENGTVGGSWTPLLRYAVPLLAGLDVERLDQLAHVDFAAGIDLELAGEGHLLPREGEGWTELLAGWAGRGSLNLADGAFTPSSRFAEVAKLLGTDSRLHFERITTSFELADGFVLGPDLRFSADGDPLGLSGRTGLDGSLEWNLALGPWLQRSERGKQLLEVVGEDALAARLSGDLARPKVDLKDLAGQVLDGGLKGLLDRFGRDPKGTVDHFRKLIDRDRRPPR